MTPGPTINRSLKLKNPSVPPCSVNVDVPWPVAERLGRLAELVNADDLGPTTMKELAAALIQDADEAPLPLWDKVMRYRSTTVGECAFWLPADQAELTFAARKPGRR